MSEQQTRAQVHETTIVDLMLKAAAGAIELLTSPEWNLAERFKDELRCEKQNIALMCEDAMPGNISTPFSQYGVRFARYRHTRTFGDKFMRDYPVLLGLDCYADFINVVLPNGVLFYRPVFNALHDLLVQIDNDEAAEALMEQSDAVYDDMHEAVKTIAPFCVDARSTIHLDHHYAAAPLYISTQHIYCRAYIERHWGPEQLAARYITFDENTPLWKVREQIRLRNETYQPLPEEVLKLLPTQVVENEFPHMALKAGNIGMVAYTQSAAAGEADRQQVAKAGRYIRANCPDLTDQEVKEAAATILSQVGADIHRSKKQEDFRRVYMEGPSSCMGAKADDKFQHLYVDGEFFHPAEIYAHPDNALEIVWLEVNGRIHARVIVNNDNMCYPRIYGSDFLTGAFARMEMWLRANGYSQCDEALVGQKLLRISPDCDDDAIICPYIDNGNQGVKIRDDHLIIGGSYGANHETGCLNDYDVSSGETWECASCGDRYDEDEDHQYDEYDDRICGCCASDLPFARRLDTSNHWALVRDNNTYQCVVSGDIVYTTQNLGYYDYVELASDLYDCYDIAPQEHAVEMEEGGWILRSDLEQHGYFLNDEGDLALYAGDYVLVDGVLTEADACYDDEDKYKGLGTSSYNGANLLSFESIIADNNQPEEDAA